MRSTGSFAPSTVRSRFLKERNGTSPLRRDAFLERVPDFLKKPHRFDQPSHNEEPLVLVGPRLSGTRQGVSALLAQVETLRIMCGAERPFHAGGSATGAFHTNASSSGSLGVLGAAVRERRDIAARILSWFGPNRCCRFPFKRLHIVDAGTPDSAESLLWGSPVWSKNSLISVAIVFMCFLLANAKENIKLFYPNAN